MPPACSVPRRPVSTCDEHPSADVPRDPTIADFLPSDRTDLSSHHVASNDMSEQVLELSHVMRSLDEVLHQLSTNLKFTKAIYRGTKKSLVGPGFEPTRLNTSDSIFGQTYVPSRGNSCDSSQNQLPPPSRANTYDSNQWQLAGYGSEMSDSTMPRITKSVSEKSRSAFSEKSRSNLSGLVSPSHTAVQVCHSNGSEKFQSGSSHAIQISQNLSRIPEKIEASIDDIDSMKDLGIADSRPTVCSMKTMTQIIAAHHDYCSKTSVRIWRFMEDRHSTRAADVYFHMRNFVLACSFVYSALEAFEESVVYVQQPTGTIVAMYVQMAFELVFAGELLVRFCACRNRIDFLYNVYNAIDLVSVFPILLRVGLLVGYDDSTEIVSLLGVVLVLRALKFLRHFDTFHLLLAAFVSAAKALPMLLFTMFLIVGAFASVIFYCEPRSSIPSFPFALYFGIITVSTVGAGDVSAETNAGKICSCMLAIIGPMYMAIPIGIIGRCFGEIWDDRHRLFMLQRMRRCVANAGYSPMDLKVMFEVLDHNGDGTLDVKEFSSWLEVMGLKERADFIMEIFESFDADDEGTINFEELLRGLFPHVHRHVHRLSR